MIKRPIAAVMALTALSVPALAEDPIDGSWRYVVRTFSRYYAISGTCNQPEPFEEGKRIIGIMSDYSASIDLDSLTNQLVDEGKAEAERVGNTPCDEHALEVTKKNLMSGIDDLEADAKQIKSGG